jgi:hypothetical protein
MTNFPVNIDDDVSLPPVNDNITDTGADAINALREAMFAVQETCGVNVQGTKSSLAARLGISINNDGTLKSSAIAGLGLITLPITNNEVSPTAAIAESKLDLDHSTEDLFNYVSATTDTANYVAGWINSVGWQFQPHILGALYKHSITDIIFGDDSLLFDDKFGNKRNGSSVYQSLKSLNDELLMHHKADGVSAAPTGTITTIGGDTFESRYAHTGKGIYINTSRFSTIPHTAQDIQQVIEYMDNSSLFVYGTRIKTLYTSGIPRASRAVAFTKDDNNEIVDGYGQNVVSTVAAWTYLLGQSYDNSQPVDDTLYGDDLIELKPSTQQLLNNKFDASFALIKVGDVIKVNYGTFEVNFFVKEKRYTQDGSNKKFYIRISGKNLLGTHDASVRIDRSLYHTNKYGSLSVACANNDFYATPSLIVAPSGAAMALGNGFNASELNEKHYLLYIEYYPTGNPAEKAIILPGIDVTGNQGTTPGLYTLDSVVEATNKSFRGVGYNYRFIAYKYQGNFGIAATDVIDGPAFSIIGGAVDTLGQYNSQQTGLNYPFNVVDVFTSIIAPPDALGFGLNAAKIISPPYTASYASIEAAQNPTILFASHKKSNYFVDGIERDKLSIENNKEQVSQIIDSYGEGYWVGEILSKNIIPAPNGRVQTTYRIMQDLSNTNLKAGQTITVKLVGDTSTDLNNGRFIVEAVNYNLCDIIYTDITVFDAVHGVGVSPANTAAVNSTVHIYFNSSSVSFNNQNLSDTAFVSNFKRYFEVFIQSDGKTFTTERARFAINVSNVVTNTVTLHTDSEISKINFTKISSKIKGFKYNGFNKITLKILSYNDVNGEISGYLCNYDGSVENHKGVLTTGLKGQKIRFYDESNIDFIECIFDVNESLISLTNRYLDIQLFPTMVLDDQLMLLASCQVNDATKSAKILNDERNFGNISEKDVSSSLYNYLSAPERLLHGNGVIRGFDLDKTVTPNPKYEQILLQGGEVLVNGRIVQVDSQMVALPRVVESATVDKKMPWILCINDRGEYQLIAMLDNTNLTASFSTANRKMKVLNVITNNTYYVDAITFRDLVSNRKDLIPLYLLVSTETYVANITSYLPSVVLRDVRRYVTNIDNNIDLRFSDNNQGNYRSAESIFSWLLYNKEESNTAVLSGVNETIYSLTHLSFTNLVTLDGLNNCNLTFDQIVTLGGNCIFKNMNLVFNGGVAVSGINPKNITFDNCNITINQSYASTMFDLRGASRITFNDCTVIVNPTIAESTDNSQIIWVGGSNKDIDLFVKDTRFVLNFVEQGVGTPGSVIRIDDGKKVVIDGCEFEGNHKYAVRMTNCSHIDIINSTSTSSYDVSTNSSSNYRADDLVNAGLGGHISLAIIKESDGINIKNNTFNYKPVTPSSHRLSFIDIYYINTSSMLSNLNIENNRFNHLNIVNANTSTAVDDIRSAISIVNKFGPSTMAGTYSAISGRVYGNICDKNQMIIISAMPDESVANYPRMDYNSLVPFNFSISHNVCGTVGYWVGGGRQFGAVNNITNIASSNTLNFDKVSKLTISSNLCHYIASMSGRGWYWSALSYNYTSGPGGFFITDPVELTTASSGNIEIIDNSCNWIHTSVTYNTDPSFNFIDNASLNISDNRLTSYDVNYHKQFQPSTILGSVYSKIGSPLNYAISILTNKYREVDSTEVSGTNKNVLCMIVNNTCNNGYYISKSNVFTKSSYTVGYVYCQCSNIISENTFKGLTGKFVASGAQTSIREAAICVGGLFNKITDNNIYKEGAILNYIDFYNTTNPDWDGLDSLGMVVDNFFNSRYAYENLKISGVFKSAYALENAVFPITWTVERNKNQVGFMSIPLTNSNHIFGNGSTESASANAFGSPPSHNGESSDPNRVKSPSPYYRFLDIGTSDQLNPVSNILRIVDEDAFEQSNSGKFAFQENLNKFLPPSVKILSVSVAAKFFPGDSNAPLGDSVITLFLNKLNYSNKYDQLTMGDSTRIISMNITQTDINAFNNIAGAAACVVQTENHGGIDYSKDFVVGHTHEYNANSVGFFLRWTKFQQGTGSSQPIDLRISPIKVFYIW